MFRYEYLNLEDFPWLDIGDTFRFDEAFTMWRVVKITEKESQKVWELTPTKTKGVHDWICGVNTP